MLATVLASLRLARRRNASRQRRHPFRPVLFQYESLITVTDQVGSFVGVALRGFRANASRLRWPRRTRCCPAMTSARVIMASPTIGKGQIFFRGEEHLYGVEDGK